MSYRGSMAVYYIINSKHCDAKLGCFYRRGEAGYEFADFRRPKCAPITFSGDDELRHHAHSPFADCDDAINESSDGL